MSAPYCVKSNCTNSHPKQILKYVNPVDLLSLTHTNHYFHKTLVHPQQQHIWRTARKQFLLANIPDPFRFSEIAVAALLFGTGPCSVRIFTFHCPASEIEFVSSFATDAVIALG